MVETSIYYFFNTLFYTFKDKALLIFYQAKMSFNNSVAVKAFENIMKIVLPIILSFVILNVTQLLIG